MALISIITINYNNAGGLKKTMQSVLDQAPSAFEYIVIDGGSEDASKSVIEENASRLAYWVSEKDNGIYYAMNKGIARARGEYLIFLNSGDYFHNPHVLQQLLENGQDTEIIYGNLVMRGKGGNWTKTYPACLTFDFFVHDSLPHPATLIKRTLFDRVGLYNEDHRIISDWEFFLHAVCRFNATYKYVSLDVAVFSEDGISSKADNDDRIWKEKNAVFSRYYSAFLPDYKKLEEYRGALDLIRHSTLHRLVDRIQGSAVAKLLK
jgi:glycosyltransferase involved in cell wall biosynthesis